MLRTALNLYLGRIAWIVFAMLCLVSLIFLARQAEVPAAQALVLEGKATGGPAAARVEAELLAPPLTPPPPARTQLTPETEPGFLQLVRKSDRAFLPGTEVVFIDPSEVSLGSALVAVARSQSPALYMLDEQRVFVELHSQFSPEHAYRAMGEAQTTDANGRIALTREHQGFIALAFSETEFAWVSFTQSAIDSGVVMELDEAASLVCRVMDSRSQPALDVEVRARLRDPANQLIPLRIDKTGTHGKATMKGFGACAPMADLLERSGEAWVFECVATIGRETRVREFDPRQLPASIDLALEPTAKLDVRVTDALGRTPVTKTDGYLTYGKGRGVSASMNQQGLIRFDHVLPNHSGRVRAIVDKLDNLVLPKQLKAALERKRWALAATSGGMGFDSEIGIPVETPAHGKSGAIDLRLEEMESAFFAHFTTEQSGTTHELEGVDFIIDIVFEMDGQVVGEVKTKLPPGGELERSRSPSQFAWWLPVGENPDQPTGLTRLACTTVLPDADGIFQTYHASVPLDGSTKHTRNLGRVSLTKLEPLATGRVIDVAGEPVVGATVELTLEASGIASVGTASTASSLGPIVAQSTAPDGAFRVVSTHPSVLSALPGTLALTFWNSETPKAHPRLIRSGAHDLVLVLAGAKRLEITLLTDDDSIRPFVQIKARSLVAQNPHKPKVFGGGFGKFTAQLLGNQEYELVARDLRTGEILASQVISTYSEQDLELVMDLRD